jgi:membrane protein insertase Oxa1/YidC/SpoIIIJ
MDYEFSREEFMVKEIINDPIEGALKALQEKHELDQNNTLEEQKQNYEKQLKSWPVFCLPELLIHPIVSITYSILTDITGLAVRQLIQRLLIVLPQKWRNELKKETNF